MVGEAGLAVQALGYVPRKYPLFYTQAKVLIFHLNDEGLARRRVSSLIVDNLKPKKQQRTNTRVVDAWVNFRCLAQGVVSPSRAGTTIQPENSGS